MVLLLNLRRPRRFAIRTWWKLVDVAWNLLKVLPIPSVSFLVVRVRLVIGRTFIRLRSWCTRLILRVRLLNRRKMEWRIRVVNLLSGFTGFTWCRWKWKLIIRKRLAFLPLRVLCPRITFRVRKYLRLLGLSSCGYRLLMQALYLTCALFMR